MHADFKPPGWPAVVPRIVTTDVAGLVPFLRSVFGAEGKVLPDRPAEMRISDAIIMVSDGGGVRAAQTACLYVFVENADEAWRRAIRAGALTIEEPADMPWGDRRATVQDPWGNSWQIATAIAS